MDRYYTLCVREAGRWCIDFGAFTRADVLVERADRRAHGVAAKDLFILVTTSDQASIYAEFNRLNAGTAPGL